MTGYSIAFSPYLPVWLLILLAVLSVCVFGWLTYRRIPGMIARAVFAVAILLALANPALLEERRSPNPDVALLILDETPSQGMVNRIAATREAATTLEARMRRADPTLDIRRVVLKHDSLSDGAKGTQVLPAVREALADVPDRRFAGAVLITDGQVHDAAALGGLPPGPLHALIVGDPTVRDRRLTIVEAPSFGLIDEPMELKVRIDDPQAEAGETVRPSLSVDGTPRRIDRLPLNRTVSIPLTLDHRGASIVELSVPDVPGELAVSNNRAVVSINGVRDRLRVLLVSGEPHPGERTWRNLLKSDPSVDLVHFTILRPPEKQDGTPIDELSLIAFPTRELFEVRLHDFDLIVFDNYRRRGVLPTIYLSNIVDFVREGGALLDATGPGYAGPFSLYRTPLGDILPMEPTGTVSEAPFRPTLSDLGRRHPVTAGLPMGPDRLPGMNDAAWGQWLRQIDAVAKSGEILMTGFENEPLVTLERVGEGRVAQVASDHIWLWARGYDGGGPHAELLRRLAHWLMKEPELEEEDLRARVQGDRLSVRLRSMQDRADAPTARIEAPDGQVTDLTLQETADGQFAGELPLTQTGLYTITEGARTTRVAAGSLNAVEFANLLPTDGLLSQPVAASGGALHWLRSDDVPAIRRISGDRSTAGSDWIGLVANGDYSVVGLDSVPFLPGWLLLLVSLLCLAVGWYREAR